MRFIQCAAEGKLGKTIWVTKSSALSKAYKNWENGVTFAEMCYWQKLGKGRAGNQDSERSRYQPIPTNTAASRP